MSSTLPSEAHWALGRLTWDAIPMAHDPIILWTFVAVVLGGIATFALTTFALTDQ